MPEKKNIDAADLIAEIVELFRPSANEKAVQIKVEGSRPLLVFLDEEMMRIALRNLVSNAVKFSKANTVVSILAFEENERVKIRIINTGPALNSKVVEKLFTYGVPSSDGTSGEKGTGLGLAMASYFVQSNGGKILYEGYNPMREEVIFAIELPAKKEN